MRTITIAALCYCFILTNFSTAIAQTSGTPIPYADRHSQILTDAWISNTKTASPNALRGNVHWIRYDFGDSYAISKSKFWNINVPSLLSVGARTMIIDYSIDGTTWIEWGRYDLPVGSGSTFYEGEDGPNFNGLVARYVLINITGNHGHVSSAGLAEVRFMVAPVTTPTVDVVPAAYKLSLYPNPVSQMANIGITGMDDINNAYYQVTDISGKVLESKRLTSTTITYDVRQLPIGQYTVSVVQGKNVASVAMTVVK